MRIRLALIAVVTVVLVLCTSCGPARNTAEECTGALVTLGLHNALSGVSGEGMARPGECKGLSEPDYVAAKERATIQLARILSQAVTYQAAPIRSRAGCRLAVVVSTC